MEFSLWIEAEHVIGDVDDVCNIRVELPSGDAYALNVWTHRFLPLARDAEPDLAPSEVARTYTLPPDLIVDDFRRETLEAVIADMIELDRLPAHCLVTETPGTEAGSAGDHKGERRPAVTGDGDLAGRRGGVEHEDNVEAVCHRPE